MCRIIHSLKLWGILFVYYEAGLCVSQASLELHTQSGMTLSSCLHLQSARCVLLCLALNQEVFREPIEIAKIVTLGCILRLIFSNNKDLETTAGIDGDFGCCKIHCLMEIQKDYFLTIRVKPVGIKWVFFFGMISIDSDFNTYYLVKQNIILQHRSPHGVNCQLCAVIAHQCTDRASCKWRVCPMISDPLDDQSLCILDTLTARLIAVVFLCHPRDILQKQIGLERRKRPAELKVKRSAKQGTRAMLR